MENMSATMIQSMLRGVNTRGEGTPGKKTAASPSSSSSLPSSPKRVVSVTTTKTLSPRSSPRSPGKQHGGSSGRSSSSPRVSIEETYAVGDRVLVTENQLSAVVRFVGTTKFSHGLWIGCELTEDDDEGKNSGIVKGVTYFECAEDKGLFVRIGNLIKDVKGVVVEEEVVKEEVVEEEEVEEDKEEVVKDKKEVEMEEEEQPSAPAAPVVESTLPLPPADAATTKTEPAETRRSSAKKVSSNDVEEAGESRAFSCVAQAQQEPLRAAHVPVAF